VRLEGLGKLKKANDFIGSRNRLLPICSVVPQPTTLPNNFFNFKAVFLHLARYNKEIARNWAIHKCNARPQEYEALNCRLVLGSVLIDVFVMSVREL
jgi:hypothetical protein